MATAEEQYAEIASELAKKPGVKRANLFGMSGLKLGKTAFTGLFGNDIVFKLGESTREHEEAMALEGAGLWDSSGRNRPFKDWVRVPTVNAAQWALLANDAFQKAREESGGT